MYCPASLMMRRWETVFSHMEPTLSTPFEIIRLIDADEMALSNKFKKLRHRLLNLGWRGLFHIESIQRYCLSWRQGGTR